MEHPFLRLLVQEAPAAAFEAPLRDARERGCAPEELERLQEASRLALQLRSILQERRRREAELAALNETARDLVSLRDLERVLQAIVRRARNLLGTDTAYLTLIDEERGDTYMRVTEGTVTSAFGEVRLALGTGLGGLVAQTRSPYATPNYLADERFAHTRTIDSAVSGEGLVAILGVPLMLGDDVIGVLFAADRHERPFSSEEIALLQSLAAHAAVAIENARLFEEAQQALRDLNEAAEVIKAHVGAVERAAAAHARLTNLVLQGGGITDVAAAVAELFGGRLVVLDPEGRVIAGAGEPSAEPADDAVATTLAAARAEGRTARVPATGSGPRTQTWVSPVFAGLEHLGALVLTRSAELGDADLRILERAAQVTALLLLNQRTVAEAEQRARGDLLDDLLTAPDRDPEGLRRRAARLSVDLDSQHVVVVTRSHGGQRQPARSAAAALARQLGGLAAPHRGEVVLLVPGSDAEELTQLVSRRLTGQLQTPTTAGGAGPASGPSGIVAAHAEAERCLGVLLALGREGQAATPRELGVYGLLLSNAGRDDVQRFCDRMLGPLLDYDAKRRTALVETLRAYFDHGTNLARAAEALHVHVNTLYQRFDRIGHLVGEDWQEPERSLQLHLAIKLHDLRTAT